MHVKIIWLGLKEHLSHSIIILYCATFKVPHDQNHKKNKIIQINKYRRINPERRKGFKNIIIVLAGWLNPVFLITEVKWLHERRKLVSIFPTALNYRDDSSSKVFWRLVFYHVITITHKTESKRSKGNTFGKQRVRQNGNEFLELVAP